METKIFQWFIFILLSFFFLSKTTSAGDTKFGCFFADSSYKSQVAANFYPVFGKDPQPYYDFKDLNHFQNVYKQISDIMSKMVDKHLYNTVDSFNEFYKFRDDVSMNVTFCMNQYSSPYNPEHGQLTYSIVLNVLDRIVQYIPGLKLNIQIGGGLTEISLTTAKKLEILDDWPNDIPADHTFGVIKFKFNKRKGFMILDAGIGATTPIVVMQDGNRIENIDYTHIFANNNLYSTVKYSFITYKPLSKNDRWVVVTPAMDPHLVHIYYIPQSFCSFLQSSTKYTLIKKSKSIIKRKFDGRPVVDIMFDLETGLVDADVKTTSFTITFYTESNQIEKKETIKFINFPRQLTKEQKESISIAEELFDLNDGELYLKLKQAKKWALNTDFLRRLDEFRVNVEKKKENIFQEMKSTKTK